MIFNEVGDLTGVIIMIFVIIGVVCLIISTISVFLYYTLTKKKYTTKEFWMNSFLVAFILLVVSGMVCGMMLN